MQYNKTFEGGPYPTYGIASICQVMGILRTDRSESLVSMSFLAAGMRKYIEEHSGKNSAKVRVHYIGDMSISLLRTAKDKAIILQHDVINPRPYSCIFTLNGTKSLIQKYLAPQLYFDDRKGKTAYS